MEKAVQLFENKKEIYLTSLAILVTGLLSFRFFQEYRKEQNLKKQFAKDPSTFEKERLISKPELLEILATLHKECAQDLRILKEEFRKRRRAVFADEDAYQEEIDAFNRKYQELIKTVNEKVFSSFNISDQNFDESIQALSNDDDISAQFNILYKVEDVENANVEISQETMVEILKYNNKRYFELANAAPGRRSYEYLLIRIQDEIYESYKIEVENLMNYFEKYCNANPNFSLEIQALHLSTSKLFSV